ncbi:MAG TPA: ribosome silencing factor [Frankiaceae bacterium]|nr:ribosome silencing factor [Frankiaceae bacterium]
MPATPRAVELALVAAQAAADKVAHDIVVIDVSDRLVITDCFVVCSAPNERQVSSVVEEVERRMREHGVKPVLREGDREARWVLIDFGDVVVHIQHDEERRFYALERLWKDCPVIPFVDRDVAAADQVARASG